VTVLDNQNEGHAVLTVITDKGDYVLDNKKEDILLWSFHQINRNPIPTYGFRWLIPNL